MKVKAAVLIMAAVFIFSGAALAGLPGDVDGSGSVNLKDVIISLQVCSGMTTASTITGDINLNGKIGLEEAVFALRWIADGNLILWYKDADGDGYSDGTFMLSTTRPSSIYYQASELIATSGDKNDYDPNIHPQAISITYPMSSLQLTFTIGYNGQEETVISSNTPRSVYIGKPILPVIPCTVVIPSGYEIDHIDVIPGEKVTLSGTHTVEHGQQPYPLLPDVIPLPTPLDNTVYGSDSPYPEKLQDVVGIQSLAGVSILMVNLNPMEYKPLSGQLSYYKNLSIKVITNPKTTTRQQDSIRCYPSHVVSRLKVDNPETLATYSGQSLSTRDISAAGFCNPADTFKYVLITSKAIRDASTTPNVRDLIAQRQSQGLSATIVTTEDIYANYSGIDPAEKVRNFIKDAYNNWETEFVLLGGDTNIIPMRKLYCQAGSYVDDIPSDLYYQCLDGTYNSNGNSRWGEPTDGENGKDVDLLAEVYVGRASAENETEMSNFVYKTVAYENDTSSYKKSALMCGEYLGFGGESDYATGSMEEIRTGSSKHGYTTAGFASDPLFTVNTLYDVSGNQWNKSAIIDKINSNAFSIINHLGHANYNYVMRMINSDADALSASKFIFAYSQGCIPGNFEEDCIAEHLTTSTRKGMFAAVFNSRYGWGTQNSTDGPSQRYDREFWDAFFNENKVYLGAMNAASHQKNAWRINEACMRWCYYETNLLGDPATSLAVKSNCTYQISPASKAYFSTGGSGSISVTASVGCGWTAVSNNNWITITSGNSGSANGTVQYSVAQNLNTGTRTGTITIAGNTFTVTQEGVSVCTYSISPENKSFSSSGGIGSIAVTAPAGCTWNAASNQDWIVIISGESGSGNGTVYYSVLSFLSTGSRSGTLAIAGKTFTVSQNISERPSAPTNVRSTTHAIGVSSKNNMITVTWTASSDVNGDLSGYAVVWDNSSDTIPLVKTLSATATSATSPALSGGTYYFHIRATDAAGNYSDTVHFGPFIIDLGITTTTSTTTTTTFTTTTTIATTTTISTTTTTTSTTTTTIPGGDFTNSLGMTFKLIPAGTFTMGSPTTEFGRWDDETQHQVTLTKSFYMQTMEVTQGQWKAVMGGANPSYFSSCGDNCPIETVSWDDIQIFLTALNSKGEGTYRLPTEAEWEYAARAGSTTAFYNGGITYMDCTLDSNLNAIGWYCGNSGYITHPVAQKQANAWGLYDMAGNVWEWCSDWYGSYATTAVTDPVGPSTGSNRVIRGGSWGYGARYCRSAFRHGAPPGLRADNLGFRVQRSLP